MGDGVNIAARLEGVAAPGAICLSEDAYRQVSGRLDMEVTDLGPTQLKNIDGPIRAYSLQSGCPGSGEARVRRQSREPKKRSAARGAIRRWPNLWALIVICGSRTPGFYYSPIANFESCPAFVITISSASSPGELI